LTLLAALAAPAFGGPTPGCSGSYALSSSVNCEQVDKLFSSYSLSPNGSNPNPGAANTSAGFTGATATGPITENFSFFSGNGYTVGNGSGIPSSSFFIGNLLSVDTATNPNYFVTSFGFAIGSYSVPAAGQSGNLQIFTDFCTNSATLNCTTSSPNWGQISFQTNGSGAPSMYYCFNGDPTLACSGGAHNGQTVPFTLAEAIQSLAISRYIILNTFDGSAVSLTGFSDTVTESSTSGGVVPEPASFGMMGAVVIGGLLLHRFRTKI
jgi:hypothetical protein